MTDQKFAEKPDDKPKFTRMSKEETGVDPPDKPEHTWNIWLPSEDHTGGYAWIVIDSSGRFTTISDYGNYGYWWGAPGPGGVRSLLCTASDDYLVGKLGMGQLRFCAEKTRSGIEKALAEALEEGEINKEKHEEEWDEAKSISNEIEFADWANRTKLDCETAHGAYTQDYPQQLYAFVEKVMPRLRKLLKAAMAADALATPPATP